MRFPCHIVKRIRIAACPVAAIAAMAALSGIAAPGKADGDAAARRTRRPDSPEIAKRPPVVLRSPFWRNPVKADCTARAAAAVGAAYVDAGPLGAQSENMALGLFAHKGVARHPGDLGMRRLADLILSGFGENGK